MRLRTVATAAYADLETNAYWGARRADSQMEAYRRGVAGGLGGAAGDLAAVWTPAATVAVAEWLEAIAKRFREDVEDDSPDCPNCGTACAGHPWAWWCGSCGGAVESPHYDHEPCKCYAEALSLSRHITTEAADV